MTMLDDATMKQVVAKAIIDTLTPERREEIMTKAVQNLLTEKANSNYNSPTVIQDAFNRAVADMARTVAVDQLKNHPEVKAKMETMMLDAWAKVTGEEYSKVVNNLAAGITKGLTGDRY